MSTGEKRPHAEAWASAERFRALFESCYSHWSIAGSIRRRRPMVGDVEHVVIPKFVQVQAATMFGAEPAGEANLLWQRADELLAAGTIAKAAYPDGRHRWGPRLRGVVFDGFRHEIFTADRNNLGPILTIRTGPAEFSEHMVTALKLGGRYRQQDGYLRYASGASAGDVRPCQTEREFFQLCGVPWLEPEQRDGYQPKGGHTR